MKTKQVFIEYAIGGNQGHSFNYCPACRTKCEVKEIGGRSRKICPKCQFVQYKNPAPAVSVLVIDDDRILLGKRADSHFRAGLWCLPCGFIEFDEDFLTAARREVMEETGLVVDIESILSVMTNYLEPDLHTLVVVLLAKAVAGTVCPGDDIVAAEWFPLGGPLPELAFAADQEIIERYYKSRLIGAPVDDFYAKS